MFTLIRQLWAILGFFTSSRLVYMTTQWVSGSTNAMLADSAVWLVRLHNQSRSLLWLVYGYSQYRFNSWLSGHLCVEVSPKGSHVTNLGLRSRLNQAPGASEELPSNGCHWKLFPKYSPVSDSVTFSFLCLYTTHAAASKRKEAVNGNDVMFYL